MTRWLSVHARYACRHAGACCTSGWPIPLEAARVGPVQRAIDEGEISAPVSWLVATEDEAAGLIAVDTRARCVFRQGGHCAIHGALGHQALPAACQHFPRVALIDARGIFVTLSHYCPTAAGLLFDEDEPLTIVDGPPALPDGSLPEGLDARDGWPPLLTERTLMDLEAYARWEAHMVATLAEGPPARALARLDADVTVLESWRPDHGRLVDAVRAVSSRPARGPAAPGPFGVVSPAGADTESTVELFECIRRAVPPPLTWLDAPPELDAIWHDLIAPTWSAFTTVVGRYLAARAFASWVAYQGRGLRAVVRSIHAALAALEIETARVCAAAQRPLDRSALLEGIRQSDLLLVHYADRQALADMLSC